MDIRVTTTDLGSAWRGQRLIADFLTAFERVAEFWPYRPSLDCMEEALVARAHSYSGPRVEVVAALREANRRYGAGEATERSLDALAEEGTFAVVTGQQPGLLTGPLYTLYKALTAILLCRHLSSVREERFVPVFWMATEDDDWEEINRAWFVSQQNNLQALEFPVAPEARGRSVGSLPLEASIEELLSPLSEHLPETEFRDGVWALLQETYASSQTLGEWWAQLFTRLFEGPGLILYDPLEPALQRLAGPVFETLLADPLAPTRAANAAGDRLVAAGYTRQTHKVEDQCPFFVYREGRRERVRYQDGSFVVGGDRFRPEELRAWLATEGERFSSSLILRPLIQDSLLPTGIFIGGPAEFSYFAQLRAVYATAGISPPLFLPRLSATLVEPKVARILRRYKLTVPHFWGPVEGLISQVTRETVGDETGKLFSSVREQLEALWVPLQTHVTALDPSLERTAEQTRGKMQRELSRLEEKTLRALKRQNEILVTQLQTAHTHLFPRQGLQERLLNLVPFLIKFGPDLLTQIAGALEEVEIGQHAFLEIQPWGD